MMNDMQTVNDPDGMPALLLIRERDELLICDSNNLERNLKIRMSVMPTLLAALGDLESATHVGSIEPSKSQ